VLVLDALAPIDGQLLMDESFHLKLVVPDFSEIFYIVRSKR